MITAEGCGDGSARVPDRQPKDMARKQDQRKREKRSYGFSLDELTQNFELRKSRMNMFLFQCTCGHGICVL